MNGQRRHQIIAVEVDTDLLLRISKIGICVQSVLQSWREQKPAKNTVHTIAAQRHMFEKRRQIRKKVLGRKAGKTAQAMTMMIVTV